MPIINTPIIKSLREEFKPYAEEVILNNLPMIDGLLLSHKKVLWGMYVKHIIYDKPFAKNIKNQGYIVEFYVYGDMPLAKVMVNMADNGVNIPYLEWDGNSGDKFRKEGKPASARYTGSRMSRYGVFMLQGIENNAVPMKPNYDNTTYEPIIAPSIAPNILLNNSESIAISEASKIPPHNVIDTCDSITNYIKNNDIDKAIEILKCPDFCNGSKIIYNKKDFEKIYKEGRGSFSLVGKYTYNEKSSILSIIEVPYTTTIDAIESAILEKIEKNNLFKEVTDTRNASGKDGLKLDIYLKKNTDIKLFEKQLRKYTPFESKYSCNFTILGLDLVPYLMNLEGVYTTWIKHRIKCIKNETRYNININKKELNKLYGLEIINKDLDKAIQIIRSSKTEKIAIENLIDYFKLNQEQVDYVCSIRLPKLNQEWLTNKIKNIKELEEKNIELEEYIISEKLIKETIISQLEDVKKVYGKPRFTEIIHPENDLKNISKEDFIQDNSVTIVLTKDQYLKKNQKYSENQTVKDGDEVLQILQTTNKKDLLLFTNQGRVFTRRIYELVGRIECTPSALGEFIPNILKDNLNKDEKIIYIASPENYDKGYMLYIFENNNIVKMAMKPYYSSQNRMKPQDAFNTESPLKYIKYIEKDINILTLSSEGKMLIQNTEGINPKTSNGGKRSQGNSFVKLKNADLAGVIFEPKEDDIIKFKTEKKDCVEINLTDICQNSKDKLPYFNYCFGNKNTEGNFIFNCRQKNDKILELLK